MINTIEITRRNTTPKQFISTVMKELNKKFGNEALKYEPVDFDYWEQNNFDVTISSGTKRTDEYFFLQGMEFQFDTDSKGLGYFFIEEIF